MATDAETGEELFTRSKMEEIFARRKREQRELVEATRDEILEALRPQLDAANHLKRDFNEKLDRVATAVNTASAAASTAASLAASIAADVKDLELKDWSLEEKRASRRASQSQLQRETSDDKEPALTQRRQGWWLVAATFVGALAGVVAALLATR